MEKGITSIQPESIGILQDLRSGYNPGDIGDNVPGTDWVLKRTHSGSTLPDASKGPDLAIQREKREAV
jgi:hypothetical protein